MKNDVNSPDYLLHRLERWCKETPDKVVMTFLVDKGVFGGNIERQLTFAELKREASSLCMMLQKEGIKAGDRVVLVYLPSLDFIIAFVACMMGGMISVPVFPPDPRKRNSLRMFSHIVQSSGSKFALTDTGYNQMKKMVGLKESFMSILGKEKGAWPENLKWIVTNSGGLAYPNANIPLESVDNSGIAFLQYTSGSTSEPKGVMITHDNVSHNCSMMQNEMGGDSSGIAVSWLPQYHDLGLIGSYLGPIYAGGSGYYMSPLTFLHRPMLWLEAVSRFNATHTAAPNFAYRLAVRKFSKSKYDKGPNKLNLSSLAHMTNAAEPVDSETINNFIKTFAPYGLNGAVIFPSYGIAEHTVFVCSGGKQVLNVDKEALEVRRKVILADSTSRNVITKEVVGCGFPERNGVDVRIVDHLADPPVDLGENRVGEIWVRSKSKAGGYFNRPEMSAEVFEATIGVNGNLDYLRTGDLGFLHNNELFICGRIKDLIIVGGRNVYPHDIEGTGEGTSDLLRPGCSAAFAIDGGWEEKVVLLMELREVPQESDIEEVCAKIISKVRSVIRNEHSIELALIVLLKPRSIPKTTSGKIARAWCKRALDENKLEVVYTHVLERNINIRETVEEEKKRDDNDEEFYERTMISDVNPPDYLLHRLERWCKETPDKVVMTFLADKGVFGGNIERQLTFAELKREASSLCMMLQKEGITAGDRVVLVYLPSLDFIIAFVACMMGGMISVPVFPPDPRKRNSLRMFSHIVQSSGSKFALTDTGYNQMKKMVGLKESFMSILGKEKGAWPENLKWIVTNSGGLAYPNANIPLDRVDNSGIAFLQYTSGSTSEPKGVMITHDNVSHNCNCMQNEMGGDSSGIAVSWLPQYHDLGLIGSYLGPIYAGGSGYYMSPLTFLHRPMLWLEAVSRFNATHTAAPNFAYRLAVRKFSKSKYDKGPNKLNLSSLAHMTNAAEPVDSETINNFIKTFAPYGLNGAVIFPSYGIAEHTVFVCSGGKQVLNVDKKALEVKRKVVLADSTARNVITKEVVGCGFPERNGVDVRIVDHLADPPVDLGENRVGEIWVRSKSKAGGYFNRPEMSAEVFEATIGVNGNLDYLRTGDLGFLHNNELFICGRIKDLIIVGGRNVYPHDIEGTGEGTSDLLRPGCSAAFVIDGGREEKVALLMELKEVPQQSDVENVCVELIAKLRSVIRNEHSIELALIVLLKPRSIPKTTSGKIARAWCKRALDENKLEVVYTHVLERNIRETVEEEKKRDDDDEELYDLAEFEDCIEHSFELEKLINLQVSVKREEVKNLQDPVEHEELKDLERPAERKSYQFEDALSLVVSTVASTLKIKKSDVPIDTPLSDIGFTSMLSVEFLDSLSQTTGIEVPVDALFYGVPTVRDIAQQIVKLSNSPKTEEQIDHATVYRAPASEIGSTLKNQNTLGTDKISIIGVSCRFPGGVTNLDSYWKLLSEGVSVSTRIPYSRWDNDAVLAAQDTFEEKEKSRGSYGAFVNDMEFFDPSYFNMSEFEAAETSPQFRVLLECAYLAFKDAGFTKETLKGQNCGVFVGIAASLPRDDNDGPSVYKTANTASIATGRISYVFDLHGPCVAYDTACSSSLVALHAATQALQNGDCDIALVAGVNELFHPLPFLNTAAAGMTSPTGRCHTWDSSADGYLRGEGCGAVVLKRLDLTSDDTAYATLLGSSVASDGKTASITAPNAAEQEQIIQKALMTSGIAPSEVDYIEAHGTGTALGDPIELGAMLRALGRSRDELQPLTIGSAKSNIGHLEYAAGIAGLIKAILVLQHEKAPPNAGLEILNPLLQKSVDQHSFPVNFPTSTESLRSLSSKKGGDPLVAGISSFGYSGTIAHAVLSQPPAQVFRRLQSNAEDLNEIFPKRHRIPWCKTPPHPLLQNPISVGTSGIKFRNVLHETLMEMYTDYSMSGKNVFPGAGIIEIGLAAGLGWAKEKFGYENKVGIQLSDVNFLNFPEIEKGCLMTVDHEYDGSITFSDEKKEVFATIQNIGTVTPNIGKAIVEEWKKDHIGESNQVKDKFDEENSNRFRSIQCAWHSNDKKSVLAEIALPVKRKHIHDQFYHIHPAILDSAFQMAGFLLDSDDKVDWVPESIGRVVMYRPINMEDGFNKLWAKMKVVQENNLTLQVSDENGIILEIFDLVNEPISRVDGRFVNFSIGSKGKHRFLLDHCINGQRLFPTTGYLYSIWMCKGFDKAIRIKNLEIRSPIFLDPEHSDQLTLLVTEKDQNILIRYEGNVVASALVEDDISGTDGFVLENDLFKDDDVLQKKEIYMHLKRFGYEYKDTFQLVTRKSIPVPGATSFGELGPAVHLIPYMDNFLQLFLGDPSELILPTHIDEVVLHPSAALEVINGVTVSINAEAKEVRSSGLSVVGINGATSSISRLYQLTMKKQIFLRLGEHLRNDKNADIAARETTTFMASRLVKFFKENQSYLETYPWLKDILHHARVDAADTVDISAVNHERYENDGNYKVVVDLYKDIPKLLENPSVAISDHPEHESLYENNLASASTEFELASLLGLFGKEWHGTLIKAFEVGSGSGSFARRAVPLLEEYLDQYVCSDISPISLGSLENHRNVTTTTYDVNDAMTIEDGKKNHLILASNSLHNARNIKIALEHLKESLVDRGMILLEEATTSQPLYLHGLEKTIWSTTDDKRSFGLWMSWSEWLAVVNSIEGLELLSWHRSSYSVIMLLRKVDFTNEEQSSSESFAIVDNWKIAREKLEAKEPIVYKGFGADGFVKSLKLEVRPSSEVKSLIDFDGNVNNVSHEKLPLNFNLLKSGQFGSNVSIPVHDKPSSDFHTSGTHIITGGLGGFGLELSLWLLEKGASKVVLTSRSGIRTGWQRFRVNRMMRLYGSSCVEISTLNAMDQNQCEALVENVGGGAQEVKGIWHLAMVLKDIGFSKMDESKWNEVNDVKVKSLLNLDRITRNKAYDLDAFVCFSSCASYFGSIGQANYSHANAACETIIEKRNEEGATPKGLAVQWGLIDNVGVIVQNEIEDGLEIVLPQNVDESLNALSSMLSMGGVVACYRGIDREKDTEKKSREMMEEFVGMSFDELRNAVELQIFGLVQSSLGQDEDLTLDSSLMDRGIDSLGVTFLTKEINKRYSLKLAPTVLFNYTTVRAVAKLVSDEIFVSPSDEKENETKSVQNVNVKKARTEEEIAIVGMSCRFPGGVVDPESFWKLLSEGKYISEPVPFDRWDSNGILEKKNIPEKEKKSSSFGAFVQDFDHFDPAFFGISEAEAKGMGPAQRILLECSYLAFRDAGYTIEDIKGKNVGVFIGIEKHVSVIETETSSTSEALTIWPSMACGGISFYYNFRGPCASYDTVCSSSHVALDAAVKAIQVGDCDMALVGGLNQNFDSRVFEEYSRLGMLSPTGRCHTWDATADGYLRGEGCGVVILKPVKQKSPDPSYGTILSTMVGSDGKSATISAPSGSAQEELIQKALAKAGITPKEVDYVEAHGTGTSLGDPIEVGALGGVFANAKSESRKLVVGSVKANIGHQECAAGIAGLIKTILVLQHESACPNVGLETLNPMLKEVITSQNFPVSFPTSFEPLRPLCGKNKGLLVGGISSFGATGVIAHVIVQQAPQRTARRIEETVDNEVDTMGKVAFLFTGQGSQYPGMGKKLYEENEDFRIAMNKCENIYKNLQNGESLMEKIFTLPEEELAQTAVSQPALVALEWSLSEMWKANGVSPSIVLGHSIGEVVAACVAGAFSIDDALHLAIVRGKMMQSLPKHGGVMVAVRLSAGKVQEAISSCLSEEDSEFIGVGSVNGPTNTVISGRKDLVEKVLQHVEQEGRFLKVSHAFHSPLMKEMESNFRKFLTEVDIEVPLQVPIASTVTGDILHVGKGIDAEHWVKQLAAPVLFSGALEALLDFTDIEVQKSKNESLGAMLEMGPSPILTRMAKTWLKPKVGQTKVLWVPSLQRQQKDGENEQRTMKQTINRTKDFLRRSKFIHLDRIFPDRRKFHWGNEVPHPLLQTHLAVGTSGIEFHTVCHERLMGLYGSFFVNGKNTFPASGMVELGLAAGLRWAKKIFKRGEVCIELKNMEFSDPHEINLGSEIVSTHMFGEGMEMSDNEGTILATIEQVNALRHAQSDSATVKEWQNTHCNMVNDIQKHYAALAQKGFQNGAFQSIQSVWYSEQKKSVLAQVTLPAGHTHVHDKFYHIHPALLDGIFQLAGFLLEDEDAVSWSVDNIRRFVMHRPINAQSSVDVFACMSIENDESSENVLAVKVCDEGGLLMTVEGLSVVKVLPKASIYTPDWMESNAELTTEPEKLPESNEELTTEPEKLPESNEELTTEPEKLPDIGVIQLTDCEPLDDDVLADLGASQITASKLKKIPTFMVQKKIPSVILIPIFGGPIETSNIVSEEIITILQFLSTNLTAKDQTRRVVFLTCNSEGPMKPMADQSVPSSKQVLAGGAVWGLIRTAALEVDAQKLSLLCVDTDYKESGSSLSSQLTNALLEDKTQREVAFRGMTRYERKLSPSPSYKLHDVATSKGSDIGVVIITGGLGGLGLLTAETIVELGASHVVLCSRSGKAKNYEGQNLETRLSYLLEQNDGLTVSTEACDVCDEEAVSSLLSKTRNKYGSIDMVIHASGVSSMCKFDDLDGDTLTKTFDPKARGAWLLHKHTLQDNLKQFVVYSSISAIFGSRGLAAYSAANAYIDTLIRFRRSNNLAGLSVQWPAIADVGMAAEAKLVLDQDERASASMKKMFGNDEMLDTNNLKSIVNQIVALKHDTSSETVLTPLPRTLLEKSRFPPGLQSFVSQVAVTSSRKKLKGIGRISSNRATQEMKWTQQDIVSEIEAALKSILVDMDTEITHDTNLMDAGLDSLAVVSLLDACRSRFGVDVPVQEIMKQPTIEGVSQYIFKELNPTEKVSQDKAPKPAEPAVSEILPKTQRKEFPDLSFEMKVVKRNMELFAEGFYSYFVVCSRGFTHEVFDTVPESSTSTFKDTILLLTNLNFPVVRFTGLMSGLRKKGYRVISIAQSGLERTEFNYELTPGIAPAERVHTNLELIHTILLKSGSKPSFHVIGHSYGAACSMLLALRATVSLESDAFMTLPRESEGGKPVPSYVRDCELKSLTFLNWATYMGADTLSRELFEEFFLGVGRDVCLGGHKMEAHLVHMEAASNTTMGDILRNVMPMYGSLELPILLMNTAEDECYNTEQVNNTAKHLKNATVMIEEMEVIKDPKGVHDLQHFMLFGPEHGCNTAEKIDNWIIHSAA